MTRCGTPTNLIKRQGCTVGACACIFCRRDSAPVSKNTFLASEATCESKEAFAHANCRCVLHTHALIPCTQASRNALLAGSMCQWLILPASQGRPNSAPSSASPPPPHHPVTPSSPPPQMGPPFISPQNTNNSH